MKSSEYWEKRIANGTWQTYNNLEEKNRALLEMYQDASLQISEELYKVAEKMKTSTPTLSDMHKFKRLTGLQNNMENIIKGLGENVETFGKNNMVGGFKDTYSNVMVELGQTQFSMVPKKVMEEMMNRPWLGSNFSERLWKNTQVLANNLNEILVNGLTQGKTITEMAIQLNNMMNKGFNVSHRLIRSETMHYLNESAKRGYKDGGCEEVQVWAAVDERTCEVCGAKHGKPYKVDKAPTLPFHANCRCTYLPIIDKDDAKKEHDVAKEEVKKEWGRRSIPEEKIKDKIL
ncbi:minor capsid protein [Clostridium sp.]|uniref:minor capsid protein n=1 Tax=Clostridium sp. TaxID=1506 RepID=UPI003216C563